MEQTDQRRLMGVRAIAAALTEMGMGVNASTISRGLKQRLFHDYGVPGNPLLDLDEVVAVRRNHLDPVKQAAAYVARGVTPAGGSGDVPAGRTESQESLLGAERLREARAKASNAELDLMEREGTLAPVMEFQDGGFELGVMVRDALSARVPGMAAELLGVTDARAAAAIIDRFDREVCQALSDKVEKLLADVAA
ncbi:hypothetical protein [Azospirillum sp. B4]|uniref:hypothetical protein n=1 Tax=Azospirillum sp. B4 TaxID=95605 RepID=UPI0005C817B1|nr:hypothetical protein [Azospirillum sp. B4]